MTECLQKYHFDITPIENYHDLSSDWRLVERSSNTSFFLSNTWIETWLKTYSPSVDVLSVKMDGVLVGLVLLSRSQFSQWKRFSSKRLHLNQTGIQEFDQIWTEYNGVLVSAGHESAINTYLVPYLLAEYANWDELQVGL